MHVTKVKLSTASGGLVEHDYRYPGDGHEHPDVKRGDRTGSNLVVTSGRAVRGMWPEYKSSVRQALTDAKAKHQETAGRRPKSNAVGLVSTVVTLPFDWPGETHPPLEFFKAAYQALEEYYEVNGVDSAALPAAVHVDETTPHMHHLKVPLKGGRLDANGVLNRAFYDKLHPWVQQRVTELTGVECSVLLDGDDAERRALSHVPQEELEAVKRGVRQKARSELARERSELARSLSEASKRMKRVETREAALDAREAALNEREAALDEREGQLRKRESSLGLRAKAASMPSAAADGKSMAVDRWA